MARIPVEREHRGTPKWVWIVGVLVLAGLIWLVAGMFDVREPLENNTPQGGQTEEVTP